MRIYTDASSRGAVSGIAFVVTDARDRELYKKGIVIEEPDNNTAELCAILYALQEVQYVEVKHVTIFTDSWYAINAVRNNVKRKKDKHIVKEIRRHMDEINSSLMWIKGHYKSGTVLSYYNKTFNTFFRIFPKIFNFLCFDLFSLEISSFLHYNILFRRRTRNV